MRAGVGFLSRFCFAVMELGGQVALCDGVSIGDSLQGSAERMES